MYSTVVIFALVLLGLAYGPMVSYGGFEGLMTSKEIANDKYLQPTIDKVIEEYNKDAGFLNR